MTDEDSKLDPKSRQKKTAGKKPDRVRSGSLTGGLALIFAAIAVIATAYLWYALLLQRADLLSTDVVGDLQKLDEESTYLRENLAQTTSLLDEVRTNQDSIRAALDKIQNDLSRHRLEWVMAESEQLMVIANNRLQLARDVRSALAALRAADAQLNQIPNPALVSVRRELAREIATLEAIDKADVTGISLTLGSLAESVSRLPLMPDVLRRDQNESEPAASGDAEGAAVQTNWRAQARNLWDDVLSLVRIRTDVDVQRPLLPREQEYFLRENLKLTLYGAQLALLQGNVGVFQQNLKVAQQLLTDYYDVNTQIVSSMRSELERLRASKLVAELPDITRSLSALRAVAGTRSTP
jgi:uroporphyrin-3 C-methyltransferase